MYASSSVDHPALRRPMPRRIALGRICHSVGHGVARCALRQRIAQRLAPVSRRRRHGVHRAVKSMWMERCPQRRPYVARRHASRAILLDDLCVDLLSWYTIGRAGSPSELPVETAIAVAILESSNFCSFFCGFIAIGLAFQCCVTSAATVTSAASDPATRSISMPRQFRPRARRPKIEFMKRRLGACDERVA